MIALIERFTWVDYALFAGLALSLLWLASEIIGRRNSNRNNNNRKWRRRVERFADDP